MAFCNWQPFTDEVAGNSPNEAGVYALAKDGKIIYYGRAQGGSVTIRTRLVSHKAGTEGPCTQAATQCCWEQTTAPVTRERQLLEAYKVKHGRLPACNERAV